VCGGWGSQTAGHKADIALWWTSCWRAPCLQASRKRGSLSSHYTWFVKTTFLRRSFIVFMHHSTMLSDCGCKGWYVGLAIARQLLTGFPPQWPGFNPRSIHVGFVVDKAALRLVSSVYFDFPCQFSFHQILLCQHQFYLKITINLWLPSPSMELLLETCQGCLGVYAITHKKPLYFCRLCSSDYKGT
jgi:hypothetical protein